MPHSASITQWGISLFRAIIPCCWRLLLYARTHLRKYAFPTSRDSIDANRMSPIKEELEKLSSKWELKYLDEQDRNGMRYPLVVQLSRQKLTLKAFIPENYPDEPPLLEFDDMKKIVINPHLQKRALSDVKDVISAMKGKPVMQLILDKMWEQLQDAVNNLTSERIIEQHSCTRAGSAAVRKKKKKIKYAPLLVYGADPLERAGEISKKNLMKNQAITENISDNDFQICLASHGEEKAPAVQSALDVINRHNVEEKENSVKNAEDRNDSTLLTNSGIDQLKPCTAGEGDSPNFKKSGDDPDQSGSKKCISTSIVNHDKSQTFVANEILEDDIVDLKESPESSSVKEVESITSPDSTSFKGSEINLKDKDIGDDSSKIDAKSEFDQSCTAESDRISDEYLESKLPISNADGNVCLGEESEQNFTDRCIEDESSKIHEKLESEIDHSRFSPTSSILDKNLDFRLPVTNDSGNVCMNEDLEKNSNDECIIDNSGKIYPNPESEPIQSIPKQNLEPQPAIAEESGNVGTSYEYERNSNDECVEDDKENQTVSPVTKNFENSINSVHSENQSETRKEHTTSNDDFEDTFFENDWSIDSDHDSIQEGKDLLKEESGKVDVTNEEFNGKSCPKHGHEKKEHYKPYNKSSSNRHVGKQSSWRSDRSHRTDSRFRGPARTEIRGPYSKEQPPKKYWIAADISSGEDALYNLQTNIQHWLKPASRLEKESFLFINIATVTLWPGKQKNAFESNLQEFCRTLNPFIPTMQPWCMRGTEFHIPVVHDALDRLKQKLERRMAGSRDFWFSPHVLLGKVHGSLPEHSIKDIASFNIDCEVSGLYLWEVKGGDNQPFNPIKLGSSYHRSYGSHGSQKHWQKHEMVKGTNWETVIGKKLSAILRHNAMNFKIDKEGYVEVNSILNHQFFKKMDVTQKDIEHLVETNAKKRFSLHGEPGNYKIRACQGHSVEGVDVQMEEIADPSKYPDVIHGTLYEYWDLILSKGLKRMTRNHIHMTTALPKDSKEVISGMRTSRDCYIYIDLETAIRDGIKFFVSDNGVILSEGNDGVIHPKYFRKVMRRFGSDVKEISYELKRTNQSKDEEGKPQEEME